MTTKRLLLLASVCLTLSASLVLDARQGGMVAAPDRRPTEGRGPFPTLTIRNVMVIDGTGAPPFGPMNVVVENNRIARITSAGTPGVPAPAQPPPAGEVLEAGGMYLMPGFVNLHMHLGDPVKAPEAEYTYKLWLAHGITAGRGVQLAEQSFTVREKARSAANAMPLAAIRDWREFLDEEIAGGIKRYRIYHASFQDFLASKDEAKMG